MRTSISISGLVLAVVVALSGLSVAQTPSPWRYDLRQGDHLIYRYTFQKRAKSEEGETQIEARFRTHVLVTGESSGHISLGFQRNRESAELLEFRSKGKDRLAKERPDFQKRMQTRPSRFSEAQEISATGEPRYAWEMARETPSHVLNMLQEVPSLPPTAIKQGETWRGGSLGLEFRWTSDETLHGKLCHRVEGMSHGTSLTLTYWWSPESGVIEKIGFDASYRVFDSNLHETATMELDSRTRGEGAQSWLASADTRLAALQSLLLSPSVPVSARSLASVLESDDTTPQSLALTVASQRGLSFSQEILVKLRQSANVPVRLLAGGESADPKASADECHRPVPPKPASAKFGTFLEAVTDTKTGTDIPYLLRVPLTYRPDRPSPLLVYLSGGAGFAIDGVNTADDVVSGTDYLVLYPQAAAYWWTPEVAARFDAVFRDVMQNYNVDPDRVYLTGFSNGGTGSLYFAELWPQRFAAVVSQMGAGQCMDAIKQGLSNLENIPLFFIHGETDPLISPDCSRTTHAALTDLHPATKPELKILPNRGHDITLESDNGLTLAFFKNKVRNAFPKRIDAQVPNTAFPRQYWLEVVEKKSGAAEVNAEIKTGNILEIRSREVKQLRLYLLPEMFTQESPVRVRWNGKQVFEGAVESACGEKNNGETGDRTLDFADRKELTVP